MQPAYNLKQIAYVKVLGKSCVVKIGFNLQTDATDIDKISIKILPSLLAGFLLNNIRSKFWASELKNCGMPSFALEIYWKCYFYPSGKVMQGKHLL